MKKLFTIMLVLFFSYLNAQTFSGQILDSITHKPIDGVNITSQSTRYAVFTDFQGKFKIDITNTQEHLTISSIGYKNKNIDFSNFNNQKIFEKIIYLSQKTEQLDEVIIPATKKEYNWSTTLKTKRENEEIIGSQFGTEYCTYIENPKRKRGKIKTVYLDLKKTKGYLENKKYKLDYLTSCSIKFYSYNPKKGSPGIEIYSKNIIVEPENRTYTLAIDVDSLDIPFPENGVCIGVEMINTKYQNPKTTFAFIGPVFGFSGRDEVNPKTSWSRYRYENKFEFLPFTKVFIRNNKRQYLLNIDIEVAIEK